MFRFAMILGMLPAATSVASAQDFRSVAVFYETGAVPMFSATQPNAGVAERPILDALPTASSLGFTIANLIVSSPVFGWTTLFVPQLLRTIRIVRRGPPPGVETRRERLLWIASPTALQVRNNVRDHGRLIWPPLRERPLFQRVFRRR